MNQTDLPYFRSYWVSEHLLAGAYPGSAQAAEAETKLKALAKAGVSLVVCLMEEHERDRAGKPFVDYMPLLSRYAQELGQNVHRVRHPIVDGSVTDLEHMREIVRTIDAEIERGGTVYVHCWGGRGRTGSVVCCWLITHGFTPAAALEELQRLVAEKPVFQPTPETVEQRDFILRFSP